MVAKQILPVLAAVVGLASAQCSQDEFTINSQADIKALANCQTLKGNVVVGEQTDMKLDLSGPSKIDGDLTVLNNKGLTSLSSGSIGEITGDFHLQNLTGLSTLNFKDLTSCNKITWRSLTALDSLTFGTGVSKVNEVEISDTFLKNLEGLDMESVGKMDINNNKRLVNWESSLTDLSDNLNINANGLNFKASFPNLIWISNMTISNVSDFQVPSLQVVNGSMRFDSNFFTSFSAPNMSATSTGDISFISNAMLGNISMPNLEKVGGGFLIANNTNLHDVTSFPKLKTVGGAMKLRGNFTKLDFPALNDVKGAFDVVSTNDIQSACDKFGKLSSDGNVQGTYNCKGNEANANSDTTTDTNGSGNSAAGVTVNMLAVFSLTAVAAVFQAVL